MKSLIALFLPVAIFAILSLSMPAAVQAQASRTWVSGVGDDANLCTRAAPCQTLARALAVVDPGGEIDCLDSGSFAPITIDKAVTIDCGSGETGAVGSIMSSFLTNIIVQAGPDDVVQIRKLTLNGIRGSGGGGTNSTSGVQYLSGRALHLDNVNIMNFPNNGIDVATPGNTTLDVINSNIMNCANNGIGIGAAGSGLLNVSLKGVKISQGFNGVRAADNGAATFHVSVVDSIVSSNSNSAFIATTGGGRLTVLLEHSAAVNNGATGVLADGSNTEVHVSNSHIFGNGTGVSATGGAALISYQNNEIKLNGKNGAPTNVTSFD